MKRYLNLIILIIISSGMYGQSQTYEVDALVSPRIPGKILTVGGPGTDIPGFTNKVINFAINALGEQGGTVILSTGTYEITAPVHLKSNVQLVGSGKATVLKKGKGVQTEYIIDADYGELKVTVRDPAGFEPGMKVQVTDDENNSCWNVSTAYITDIIDNTIYLDNYLIRDYRADMGGKISNACSVIEVIESENVEIRNLVVDGSKEENYLADGCNGSGIYIFKSKLVTVDDVVVRDFNGEGISWQITEQVTIKNSEITGSGNIGLHPGTGSPLTVIENNNVHNNQVDGLFICWRVHHSRVSGNRFYNNGRYGICTGHKDTDVIFQDNHIYDNGSDGIHLRGERAINAPHRNTFTGNIIENNGRLKEGFGMSFNSPAEEVIVQDNIIRDTGPNTQKAGLYFYKNALSVTLENNSFSGHEKGEILNEEDE